MRIVSKAIKRGYHMVNKLARLRKSVTVMVALVMLAGGGLGAAYAQSGPGDHDNDPPVWQEVDRQIKLNPANPAPPDVVAQLVSLEVAYKDFNGHQREGIIEVNRALETDVIAFFKYAYYTNFPIRDVEPASNYNWNDDALMAADVTSSFNYRTIAGTNRPSQHGLGRAFDVNPRENPYITLDDQGNPVTQPMGARWLPGTPGTLFNDQLLIQLMKSRGWIWGGNWTLQDTDGAVIDYQHLQKAAPAPAQTQAQMQPTKEL